MPEKDSKIGVRRGGGPPPGYRWNVDILSRAYEEAIRFLNEDQYEHMADQVREIATQDYPTHSQTVDIRPIEDFYEIRDKGGVLGKINVRVFFFVHKPSRTIVVLGCIKKENDGPTPLGESAPCGGASDSAWTHIKPGLEGLLGNSQTHWIGYKARHSC